jgi:hypothetical protein
MLGRCSVQLSPTSGADLPSTEAAALPVWPECPEEAGQAAEMAPTRLPAEAIAAALWALQIVAVTLL